MFGEPRSRARAAVSWAGVSLQAALLFPLPAAAQNLAEAAAREKERRAKVQATGPVKSYTSDDLASVHVDPPPGEAKTAAKPRREAPPPPGSPDTDQAERAQKEAYWRQRAYRARMAVQNAERRVAALEQLAAQTMIAPPDGIVVRRESWEKGRARTLSDLEAARAQLVAARQAVTDLEDEARRAGALPGWLR